MKRTAKSKNQHNTRSTKSISVSQSKSQKKPQKGSVQKSDFSSPEPRSVSPDARRQRNHQNEVAFEKGTYIAFVDASDSLDVYKIGLVSFLSLTHFGQLLEDLRDVDKEVLIDVYGEVSPLTFKKEASKSAIFDQFIICDVKGTPSSVKKQQFIKITKQQENKVIKLMEGVVSKLQQAEEEDESQSEEDSPEQSSSSSSSEEEEEMKKDTLAQIKQRRMVKVVSKTPVKRGRSNSTVKKVPNTRGSSKSQAAKPKEPIKKPNNRKSTKKEVEEEEEEEEKKAQPIKKQGTKLNRSQTPKKQQDVSMEDEASALQEDSESVQQIDTSKKISQSKSKATPKKPKLGEKRKRGTSKKKISSSSADESNNEDSNVPKSSKKRKLADGQAEVVPKGKKPKAPKQVKRPTEFKKGKWNPDIVLVKEDKYKESADSKPYLDCCIRCNNKNLFRAANKGNETLLKECLKATKKISLLTPYWSPEIKFTPVDIFVSSNQHEILETLLHPKLVIPQFSNYEAERNAYFAMRIHNPQYLLNFVDSGMVSNMAYGTRVRRVQMTRGNRQGNNAFLEYEDNPQPNPWLFIANDFFFRRAVYWSMTVETLQILFKLNPGIENTTNSMVYEAVRAGNLLIANEIVQRLVKYPNYGFNNLHAEVLNPNADVLEKFGKTSVTKKANTNKDITPLHCACINPNENVLKQLLDVSSEYGVPDVDLRRPVHYAAACVSPMNLQLLVQAGANLNDVDNQKKNCLHLAAMTGRHENVRFILQTSPNMFNTKDKKGMNAMAYACKYGHLEVVKVLVELKAKVNAGVGPERMPPLSWAAAYGFYDLCEYLLDNKARVLSKDKYKRTPLIMAVRNGHTAIASLLLQRGSEWDHPDSSMNTALHYAAAYGWLECIDLLIQTGADVNASNSWKITPINIAMLKNHQGCVKKLLNQPNVDVNGKDEKGRTLLHLALVSLDEESFDFIKYLLKKGADPNIADLEGQAALHYIAKYNPKQHCQLQQGKFQRAEYDKQIEIQKQVAQILIEGHGDLTLKDKNEKTPFAICLESYNAPILQFLQNKVSLNKQPELFFEFAKMILNQEYQKILLQLIQNDKPTHEAINCLDAQGYTPFLKFIEAFTTAYSPLVSQITQRINAQLVIKTAAGQQADIDNRRFDITNADLFDQFADQIHYNTYTVALTSEQKIETSQNIAKKIIVTPFIHLLDQLIKAGADTQAQVQKLKKYRDEESAKKAMFAQLQATGEELKEKKEEKVRKREEVMQERRGKCAPKKKQPYYGGQPAYQFGAYQAPAPAGQVPVFDTRNGVKVERPYSSTGLRNAIHLISVNPEQNLFDYLIDLKINPDAQDYDETTPFNLISRVFHTPYSNQGITFDKLISLDVRIDMPDVKGRTPFLNFYEQSELIKAYRMVDLGANVNQIDTSGMFALKYALIRRQNSEIENLISKGANINQIDNKGRNLLHHAVNMSSATADATFETEQFLIDRGVELNLKDSRGRTPLHYAFVKIKDWQSKNQIDPIETVSSLCGCKGLEMDVADKWLKTPLHYASQRGASVCAVYLINRGASFEKKDIYGNTPLGVGLLCGHYNYGIILIEKKLNVKIPIFREYPDKINKQWEQEAKLYRIQKKRGLNGSMEIDEGQAKKIMEEEESKKESKKRHKNLFNPQTNLRNDYYGDEYDDEDEDSEDSYDSEDQHQENVFNQQNAFGLNVYNPRQKKTARASVWGNNLMFGGGFAQPAMAKSQAEPSQNVLVKLEGEDQGVSMFKVAIRAGQQGLAYLILDNGYDLMLAMQDAMDEKKFMLVLTLLSKNPDDEIVQQTNSKGQNLFHILSMNAGGCSFEHLKRIYETLRKRGVNCQAKDSYQRTALHYAVISDSLQLVKMLLEEGDGKAYNPNEIDSEGHSPLSLCLRGGKAGYKFYTTTDLQPYQNIFYLLVTHKADVNIVYPEKSYKPDFSEEEVDDEAYDPKGAYKCSLLIHVIRQNTSFKEFMRDNLMGLIQYGAKLNVVDSDGRDPLTYAIMNDNEPVIKMLIENKLQGELNINQVDKAGKTPVHYVVNPIKYGSYENINILQMLHKANYNLNVKDNNNKAPLNYAQEQESGVMLNELIRLLDLNRANLERLQRMQSIVYAQNWPECRVDYEVDSESFMEEAKIKEEQDLDGKKNRVPVDSTGGFTVSYEVYYDEQKKPWDVYLTKVDLKNGIYGDYVFYKMQLLYDTNRDLYVVFTRWGRIGEEGMNQRTPFVNVEEAKIEFRKIFKQKTGGNNFDELETFDRVKKKYNLTKVNYVTVDFKDYLAPFDYDKVPKSRLQKSTFDLFEEIANVTMYQRAMSQFGVDTNVLPFSGIKRESLLQARELLTMIKEAVDEDIEISKEGIRADYDKLTAIKEKISDLTSRYYELIPLANYKNQIAPPLSNHHQIKAQYDNLEGLSNIEYASKILLGALYKQKEQNPVDYVYDALNIMIEPLDKEGSEFEVINKYISNTRQQQNPYGLQIANIFKIQRKGEAEMIQAFKDVPNHFLLYHGSFLYNFIGLLSQGLRIAPAEAPPTGYMFGKGVYFADMFDKSASYAQRGYNQQDSYLMLMCEVVLGKSKELYQSEYVEKLEHQYQSVKGVGRRGPGYKHTIVLPNGVKIPYGPVIDYYANDVDKQRQVMLGHNEYIVYNTSQIRMRYIIQIKKPSLHKKA